jgi:hypothetical protein
LLPDAQAKGVVKFGHCFYLSLHIWGLLGYLCAKIGNMFSPGQIVFALFFILVFVLVMIRMYRKDRPWLRKQYQGAGWVLLFFLAFVILLLLLKHFL